MSRHSIVMLYIERIKKHKLVGHTTFWFASILVSIVLLKVYSDYELEINSNIIAKVMTYNVGFAAAVYFNLYFLFPRYLKKRKYMRYIIGLILTPLMAAFFIDFMFVYPLNSLFSPTGDFEQMYVHIIVQFFITATGYVLFTSILKVVDEWIDLQNVSIKLKETEKQKLKAELSTLKAQINPHFFFNSLNNIYSLALVNSPETPQNILKLSDLMRHVLYDANKEFISLNQELDFIENYMDLQKIRLRDKSIVSYHRNQIDSNQSIAPLIFQPFIENAFKHGLNQISNNSFIDIGFQIIDGDLLYCHISNNYSSDIKQEKKQGGIGIENVKKRLALLYPHNQHQLTIEDKNNIYKIDLKLKLK